MRAQPNQHDNGSTLVSVADLASQAGVSVTVVRRLIWSGQLPAVHVGRLVRVRLSDWQAYLEAHRVRGSGELSAATASNGGQPAGRSGAP